MPRLADHQCYQLVRAVDVAPILAVLDRLPFMGINYHLDGSDPNKPACDVVVQSQFPREVIDFMADLGLGGAVGRAVFRRIHPGQHIPVHTDAWMPGEADWRRFQIPVVTDPAVVMEWPDDGVSVHLEAGNLYEVRYDRPHSVRQNGSRARVHIQIDQVGATI